MTDELGNPTHGMAAQDTLHPAGPIGKMVQRAMGADTLRMHMPGHKGLLALPGAGHDVTEIPGTDTLFDPSEGILRAQQLAAARWGAAASRLLVNGSTAGIQAMVLWAAARKRRLYVPRNCHVSVPFACAIAGVQPVWLPCGWEQEQQVLTWSTDALNIPAGECAALLVTSPDYFGRCLDFAALRAALPSGVALLVDAAHGSHLAYSPRLPKDGGAFADLWVCGAHKTLPAPTQTAYLHIKHGSDVPLVTRLLQGVSTTSPSYLLMEGLDNARAYMDQASGAVEDLIDRCMEMRGRINRLDGLRAWDDGDARATGYAAHDPTRLVVDVAGTGMTGWQAAAVLARQGVVVEMADQQRIVCILSVVDDAPRTEALFAALRHLCKREDDNTSTQARPKAAPPPFGRAVLTLREAWLAQSDEVELPEAVGRIAAEPFGAYPPGQALAMPGEIITTAAVEAAQRALAMGGSVFGLRRGLLSVVKE